mmetsp:Transcript_22872/g.33411  ORF Transcript_22872/g.33411 Transcript_22872/m.33411 type:complete len:248 (+) Transcript_22872:94-837(+)|eukprot:CAMPEP_0185026774 /NCGR_PEP_ID=MMETSP1103-20130426/11167_1 /TAXON_ID=36769 /ORGANISM="Paraphysomonas bandaiensis, Strain Caron Lab Isolate" /LENGTH=247 /DNA_ID=CAMNT_0027560465 /DNA_START=76 /DNA_END=819 /DNA_ORIENTATION=-
MRLTADVLLRAESYLNPVRERELFLRGFKVPAVENLSVLQDQFDVIDFSDNEIRILDNFPRMRRLTTLLVNNNYVFRVGSIGENLPQLNTLVLTNNRIANLSEIDNIASLQNLECLSLMDNPVTQRPHYRLYVIHKMPQLKFLDFVKVKKVEREAAATLFESSEGQGVISSVQEEHQAAEQEKQQARMSAASRLTESQREQVRRAIESATTREEMDRIEKQLKTGTFVFAEEDGSNGHVGLTSANGK